MRWCGKGQNESVHIAQETKAGARCATEREEAERPKQGAAAKLRFL